MKKRALSIILALTMVLGMLPSSVYASDVNDPIAYTESSNASETTAEALIDETTEAQESLEQGQAAAEKNGEAAEAEAEPEVKEETEAAAEEKMTAPEPTSAETETEAAVEEASMPGEILAAGTLDFSKNLSSEPLICAMKAWSSTKIEVAVGTYTPAGGTATAIPDGTSITYKWYQSTDGQIGDSDPEVSYWSSSSYSVSLSKTGIFYYYAVVTATIDDVEYKGISQVQCVKIGAADIKVEFSLNNKGVLAADQDGKAVSSDEVTVRDLDADGRHTYDEALIAAHKALLTEDGYAKTETDSGVYVTKLWNVETSNILFYQNGKALETTVDQAEVSANDKLYASLNQDDRYYSDRFTTFDISKTSITAGLKQELTLTDAEGNPVPGMQIGTWEEGQFVPMEGVKTDENGKVTLSFAEEGTYVITASGTIKDKVTDYGGQEPTEVEFDCPIMPPSCAVTVKGRGELQIRGTLPSNTFNFKVGESSYPLKNLLTAEFYINGKRDYSANIKSNWYRIGTGSGGQAELVESLTSALTSEDVGTWKYYMYAECEIYGVKYTAMSNLGTVVIREPEAIAGNSSNGFVSNIVFGNKGAIEFSPEVTDYDTTDFSNSGYNYISLDTLKGAGLWIGLRLDGVKQNVTSYYYSGDSEVKVTDISTGLQIPQWTIPGKDYTVTVLVGTKYDSDGDGDIDGLDEFDVYDAYNFHVSVLPYFTKLTVKDENDNSIINQSNCTAFEVNGNTNSDIVKLTVNAQFDQGVKLYIGDNTTPYTEQAGNVEVSLTDYKDEEGIAHIPLTLSVDKENGEKAEHKLMLNLSPEEEVEPEPDFDAPEIITQPEADATVEKNGTVALRVEVKQPEKGEISYQWLDYYEQPIEGATEAVFQAPGETTAGMRSYYYCKVTLTIDGKSRSVLSDRARVTTNLTYVNDPVITIQPGLAANKDGGGVYKKEYVAGGKFDTMYFGVDGTTSRVNGTYIEVTETGCSEVQYQCYYNTKPSTDGAIPLSGTYNVPTHGGNYGLYVSFIPDAGLPEGENYVYFVVTSSAADDPSKTASSMTDFVKLTYRAPSYDFEGKGSESEPFQLKSGDDFVKLQKYVNENGINFSGLYFQMANDIYLPEDWESIGIGNPNNGTATCYFSGILDGGGYQLNYAKGSKPLFEYVSQATIRNMKIYGEEIQGCGLINSYWLDYNNVGAWLENITLVSGTSTKRSGLLQGNYSSTNPSYISNCHAEEGVVIGYDKTGSGYGSFAGGMVGNIDNCTSAATIYGVDCLGGMVGTKSNSMGRLNVTNCSFTGKIEATGTYIGGMAGRGYSAASAPNATCVRIQNCYVNADITGGKWVGGLFGGEYWIEQCWDNGIGIIKDNVFYGSLTATNGKTGGIIGWMSSLNRYNEIENNYYYDANGCTTPIGGVEHIDTSARAFGMGEDGIFYYDTSRDSLSDIKDFVDAEDKGTSDWGYTSVSKTDHNRTDDPMGADKDKLGKAVTTEQMTDGTVLKWLNDSESSLKNWVQGEKYPEHSKEKMVVSLTVSGTYQTEFTVGDELDLTGIILTASWTDGTTTNPEISEIEIQGYDRNSVGKQTVKLVYGTASAELTITVLPEEEQIEVVFSILGDEQHDSDKDGKVHTLTSDNLITWVEAKEYSISSTITVGELLDQVLDENGMSCTNVTGNYVDSITNKDGVTLSGQGNGAKSGWMFTVNGIHGLLGVAEQYMEDGDVIVFHYTDDYTQEQDKPQPSLADIKASAKEELDQYKDVNDYREAQKEELAAAIEAGKNAIDEAENAQAVEEAVAAAKAQMDTIKTDAQLSELEVAAVEKRIDEIGTVTLDREEAIQAARTAYDALTEAQKALVSNYQTLQEAESKLAQLKKDSEKPPKPEEPQYTEMEKFVVRLYQNVLGRTPDQNGLDAWVSVLEKGTNGGEEVARGFIFSNEYSSKKVSSDAFVEMLYHTLLDRKPDVSGKNAWAAQLKAGVSRDEVVEGFIHSDEFTELCREYGIYTTAAEAFAARLYTKCLGRNYDANGLKSWADLLHEHKIGGGEAARGFFLSPEFTGKELSNNEFVTRCYRTLLNREPDADGLKDWSRLLGQGDSRESVLDGFIGSDEYAKLCISYGIDR